MTARLGTRSLRPPLKWAGGKRWLVPGLATLYTGSERARLVEPFCGGLAVALGLRPRTALLNDINPHLVNFYHQLQKGLRLRIPTVNDRALYYSHRQTFNAMVHSRRAFTSKAAQLFYYLNRTGFNGLCRFNSSGEFNVPFGRFKQINYVRDFSHFSPALCGWVFDCGDFESLDLGPDDFVYADPPYDVEFRQYSRQGFEFEEQVRLAEWLARHQGPVVLSNQATRQIVSLYRRLGFDLHTVNAPRSISRNGDRRPAREVLALRNLEPTTDFLAWCTSSRRTRAAATPGQRPSGTRIPGTRRA